MEKRKLENLVNDLKERGVLYDFANLENFLKLESFDDRVVYWGVDCTSDSLHIGHLSNIIQLFRLSENNFKIIFILGGSTSTIGDPSDKTKERPLLKSEIVEKNYFSIKKQLELISNRNEEEINIQSKPLSCFYNPKKLEEIYNCLGIEKNKDEKETWKDFIKKVLPDKKKGSFVLLNNKDWLSEVKFIDFINNYGKNVTINYLLSKEKTRQRVESKNGMSFSEFSYSLLQGYDFLYLYEKYGCKGQVGASDQWGNFSTGLKMIKNKFENNKAFAFSLSLMLDKSGKKISKSEGKSRIVWLDKEKTPLNQLFDYFNNMEDKETESFVRRFTSFSQEQIQNIIKINEPKSLRILQRILIESFFFLMHGNEGISWIRNKKIKMY